MSVPRTSPNTRRAARAGTLAWTVSLGLHLAAFAAMSVVVARVQPGAAEQTSHNGGAVLDARLIASPTAFGEAGSYVLQTSFTMGDSPVRPLAELVNAPALLTPTLLPTPNELPRIDTPSLASQSPRIPTPTSTSAPPGSDLPTTETQVFGVRGRGSRFVYLFDRSSSMEGAPLAAAKRELVASLQSLKGMHQFQIIFYNDEPAVMPAFRGGGPVMTFADEQGKRLAAGFVGSIFPHGGTNHLEALKTALRLRPDVIFLLTDAYEPQLSPQDLREVRQNNPGTSINTIEFGVGPPQPRYNFLQQLAAENNGQHTYIDVNQFVR